MYWWERFGPFHPANAQALYPDPLEVLEHYLKLHIPSKEWIAFLREQLQISQSVAYFVLNGRAFDSFERCLQLVEALNIPPQLLGLDAKHHPLKDHPLWWKKRGWTFDADERGRPRIDQVIRSLRKLKKWSQGDLAQATGLTKVTVIKMEKMENLRSLDSLTRRRLLALALGGASSPLIMELFGLDGEHLQPMPQTSLPAITLPSSSTPISPDILRGYHEHQAELFNSYFTSHGLDALDQATHWLSFTKRDIMPQAENSLLVPSVLALQSRYHHLLLNIFREQCVSPQILTHASKAISLARDAVKYSQNAVKHSQSAEDLLTSHEAFASALLCRAEAFFEQSKLVEAKADIDKALALLPKIASNHLKAHILMSAGLIYSFSSQGDQKLIMQAFNFFAQSEKSLPGKTEPDPNFINADAGMLALRQGMAQCARFSTIPGNAVDSLNAAEQNIPENLLRRHFVAQVFLAQALINKGEYEEAIKVANSALDGAKTIKSVLNRNRIAALYQQIAVNYDKKDSDPSFIRLQVGLQMWNV
jgi:transcriptional regulator with XRE-family HTH domain